MWKEQMECRTELTAEFNSNGLLVPRTADQLQLKYKNEKKTVRQLNLGNGPGKIIVKHAEKCSVADPSFLKDGLFRYYKKGHTIKLEINMTVRGGISDENGYRVNIAIKKNGGWKPNFMRLQGKGMCSGIKSGDPQLFKMFAKQMKAPPKCPLPGGTIALNYTGSDATNFILSSGFDVMPFGEFRVSANMTYKDTDVSCYRFYVDVVPKNKRG